MANLDDLPVTEEMVKEILVEFYRNNTFEIQSMHTHEVFDYANVFITKVFKIRVYGEMRNRKNEIVETYKTLLVKIPFRDDQNIPSPNFSFEPRVYIKLIHRLIGIYEYAQVPVINALKADDSELFVITEDFTEKGWYSVDPRVGMSQEEALKLVRALARFHSFSITLKQNDLIVYKKAVDNVVDQVFAEPDASYLRKLFANPYSVATHFAELYLPMATEDEASAIQKFLNLTAEEIFNQALKAIDDTPEVDKVFVHGECWARNFVLTEDTHEKVQARITNLVTVCRASPARDLVYLLVTNPQRLDKMDLIRTYVKEFQDNVNEYCVSLDVSQQFSVAFIESEISRLKMLALYAGISLLVPISYTGTRLNQHYHFLTPNALFDVSDLVDHINTEFYVRRLMEILLEYFE